MNLLRKIKAMLARKQLNSEQFKNNKNKIIARISIILVAIIVFASIIVVYQIKTSITKMIVPPAVITDTPIEPNQHNTLESEQLEVDNMKDFYVLVMGLDYREQHNALLTDSLMVLHIFPQQSSIKLLSIPRDLLVENTSGHTVKINSLFSEGFTLSQKRAKDDPSILLGETIKLGDQKVDKAILSGSMANTRSKIETLLDVKINYSVVVNFNTVVSLVNEIGGIEIDVKRSMKYRPTNLYLDPGLQVLNGEDALGYARFREDDRGSKYFASDFERGERQQEVLQVLANEILSWGNLTKALKLLDIISDNVQTDMEFKDMYAMVSKYYNVFNGESFTSIPFPEFYSANGDVIIPEEELVNLQNAFKQLEQSNFSIPTDPN